MGYDGRVMPPMYHLDLDAAQIRGARVALLPGDPGRSRLIAERIATAHGGRVAERPLASNREFCTYLAEIAGAPVLVTSTGIGGPSTSIAVDELDRKSTRLNSRHSHISYGVFFL